MNDIEIVFPGGKRVDARVGRHLVRTDQPVSAGGEDSAVAPFDLFLASIGSCAGIYVVGFCQARKISTEGIRIVQHQRTDEAGHLVGVDLEVVLPESFPARYRDAVAQAAAGCKVKKTLAAPPVFTVRSVSEEAPGSHPQREGSSASTV